MTLLSKTFALLVIAIISSCFHHHLVECLPPPPNSPRADIELEDHLTSTDQQEPKRKLNVSDFENGETFPRVKRSFSEDHSRDDDPKDYRGWKLLRLFPETPKTTSDLLDVFGSHDSVWVLNVRKKKTFTELDLAISPDLSLDQLLEKTIRHPPLCSLNRYVQNDDLQNRNHITSSFEKPPPVQMDTRGLERLESVISNLSVTDCDGAESLVNKGGRHKRDPALLKWVTIFEDLERSFNPVKTRQIKADYGEMSWDNYYNYETILNFSKNLADTNENVGFIDIGKSHEGRQLFALVFSTNPSFVMKQYAKRVGSASRLLSDGGIRILERKKRVKKRRNSSKQRKEKRVITKKKKSETDMNSRKNEVVNEVVEDNNNHKKSNKVLMKPTKQPKKKKKKNKKKNKEKKKNSTEDKPVILIEGGAHAREWISPAVATYVAKQLSQAGSNFLKQATVVIVPLANPDGYEYTHTHDRLWRKNRKNAETECIGVDLNRNWNISWGDEDGTSSDSCSYQYCGPGPFSEPETAAIRDLTAVYLKDIKLYLSLHSFGQMVLNPWGHTKKIPPQNKQLRIMAKALLQALNNHGDAQYEGGQSSQVLYRSSGTSDDYMYSIGVPYSYTVELPNTYSFELPPEAILQTAENFWSAFVCFMGKLVPTTKAKSFCNRRIVTVTNENNVTFSSWIKKTVPLDKAEMLVLNRSHKSNS